MGARWGPGLVSMRVGWGPGLVGSIAAWDLAPHPQLVVGVDGEGVARPGGDLLAVGLESKAKGW